MDRCIDYVIDNMKLLMIDDVSDGVGMCLGDSLIFPNPVSAPIDIEDEKGEANGILVRNLIFPRLILLGPSNIAVVGELRLISLFELTLKHLLFGLQWEIFVVSAPVVEVVIVEANGTQKGTGCSQHIYIINLEHD